MITALYPYFLACVAIALFRSIYMWYEDIKANPRRLPTPPGPRSYPIIGNMLDVPSKKPWLKYAEWHSIYGDMIFFTVLNQPCLILGSTERTLDIMDKRSAKYSNRPKLIMLDLMEWFHYAIVMVDYGSWWRLLRKTFHQHFNDNQVTKYQPTQLRECHVFLKALLTTPDKYYEHTRFFIAATLLDITYGIRIEDSNHPLVKCVEEVMRDGSAAMVPGRFLVELFPMLKFVPRWFPGAGWKRKAQRIKELNYYIAYEPFESVKREMEQGIARPSVAATLIKGLPDKNAPNRLHEERVARCTTANTFVAGADTTVAVIQSFFLAMCMHPEAQRKAQEELDRVSDGSRLPDFNDRESLPYIGALAKEVMRWYPAGPLALPHVCSENDEYDGYFIPKGTIVIGNVWEILHDKKTYDDPFSFEPERFLENGKLNPEVRDPSIAAFGFGRRMCPGSNLSDAELFITIASVLTVFNILPPLDEDGEVIKIEAVYDDAPGVQYPTPFNARFVPRSEKAKELIEYEFIE